ncbi:MAG: TIR domain-containing protein [Anaerolineae bacterium]|nr:MAG: TIR domain-containing protein [Anaerolineae bacterium]
MKRIFISYSRRDKSIADYIAAQLRNRGAEVFRDFIL